MAIEGGQLPRIKLQPPAEGVHEQVNRWIEARHVKVKDIKVVLYKNILQDKNLMIECVIMINGVQEGKGFQWVDAKQVNVPIIKGYLDRIKEGKVYPMSLLAMEADPVKF